MFKILVISSDSDLYSRIKKVIFDSVLNGLFYLAGDYDSFLKKIEWMRPDFVLFDSAASAFSGSQWQGIFEQSHKEVPVLIFLEEEEIKRRRNSTKGQVRPRMEFVLSKEEVHLLPEVLISILRGKNAESVVLEESLKKEYLIKVANSKAEQSRKT